MENGFKVAHGNQVAGHLTPHFLADYKVMRWFDTFPECFGWDKNLCSLSVCSLSQLRHGLHSVQRITNVLYKRLLWYFISWGGIQDEILTGPKMTFVWSAFRKTLKVRVKFYTYTNKADSEILQRVWWLHRAFLHWVTWGSWVLYVVEGIVMFSMCLTFEQTSMHWMCCHWIICSRPRNLNNRSEVGRPFFFTSTLVRY